MACDHRQGWSELPDDLLDAVYRRCVTSLYDRDRFAAVCASWRTVASSHPPLTALPLLLPSTGNGKRDRKALAYSLEEGRALRAPVRGFPWGKRLVGSHNGGWIAATTGARLSIINLCSGVRLELTAKQSILECNCFSPKRNPFAGQTIVIRKIIFSGDPSSSDCILAAMTRRCTIALCRLGWPDAGWTTLGCDMREHKEFKDITFCNGRLYGITSHNDLLRVEISVKENYAHVTNLIDIHVDSNIFHELKSRCCGPYIFELRGNLMMAAIFTSRAYSCKAQYCRIFKLVAGMARNKWVDVTSLGDHALFLGPACSKAIHVPRIGGRDGVERDCIYYSQQHKCPREDVEQLNSLDLGSYTVYCLKSYDERHNAREESCRKDTITVISLAAVMDAFGFYLWTSSF